MGDPATRGTEAEIKSVTKQIDRARQRHKISNSNALELLELRRNRNKNRKGHLDDVQFMGAPGPSHHAIQYTCCTMCGHILQKEVDASEMVCPNCGISEPYLESTRSGLAYNEDVEFVNNTYKRLNHMKEWLNQIQGRETAPIPKEIIEAVSKCLVRSGMQNTKQITWKKVRFALRNLNSENTTNT